MIRLFCYACLLLVCFTQCEKQPWEQHYERPDWLRGNAWEVLEDRGDFSIFLTAAERAGFKDVLTGKVVATVMAPNDEAMQTYMQAHGFGTVETMPIEDLRKLIGFHLVYYAYDQARFDNYQPYGFDAEVPKEAGLFYKHRTRSRDTVSVWQDPVTVTARTVFHKERFLPVFSSTHFGTKGIDPKRNYEYFYPGSEWSATAGGFQISNASVVEYAIPTDNGYLYTVDQVLEPLETVHALLEKEADFSAFAAQYDRYIDFWFDATTTAEYGNGDSLFIVKHTGLPQIASEWSYNGEGTLPDYANLKDLSFTAFSVFAPSNQALNDFFESYWAPYYPSLADVDFLPMALLLGNHVYSGNVVFPDEIVQSEDIKSTFGNPIVFDPYTETSAKGMASNGVFYGLDKVIVPPMFYSVTGPLLQNPDYKMFLHMVANTAVANPLMSDVVDYTLFIPSDEVMQETLYGDSYLFWNEGHPLRYGDEAIEVENSEGIPVAMGQGAMEQFASGHIAVGRITEFSGKQVFRTRIPYNYLYVTDAGVASSASYNLGEFISAQPIAGEWTNGLAYEVDAALLRESGSIKFTLAGAGSSTNPLHEFVEFSKLLTRAELLPSGAQLSFLLGERFLLFAPSDEAVLAAIAAGTIPEDPAELAEYLKYYFVPVNQNSLSDYPFPGFGIQGDWQTAHVVDRVRSELTVVDQGDGLQVRDATGQTAQVIDDFPKTFNDGAVYRIDGMLSAN